MIIGSNGVGGWPVRPRVGPWAEGLPDAVPRRRPAGRETPLAGIGICWIPVGDMERALAFWTIALGLTLEVERTGGEGVRRAELSIPGTDTRIGLVLRPTAFGDRGCHAGLQCTDVQKAYRDLASRGVEFLNPPTCDGLGVRARFVDPDGNVFTLTSAPC